MGNRVTVCYERPAKEYERYVMTSCLKRRLASVEPDYEVTSDTRKVTCEDCKNGMRYITDHRKFILFGEI